MPKVRHPRLRLTIGSDREIWIEERLREPWDGWIVASKVVPDSRGLPVLNEVRVYAADSIAPGAGVPWALIRRGVALSEHARFAANMIAGALHVRGAMTDLVSRRLTLALAAAGFSTGAVPLPEAMVELPGAMQPGDRHRRGRPSVWTSADYARVALLYDDAIAARRSPQQEVARATGRPLTVARNLIAKARKLELIPKAAKQGRWSLQRLSSGQRAALSRQARESRIKRSRV